MILHMTNFDLWFLGSRSKMVGDNGRGSQPYSIGNDDGSVNDGYVVGGVEFS